MKAVVVGGQGFLGSHLIRALLDREVKRQQGIATSTPPLLALRSFDVQRCSADCASFHRGDRLDDTLPVQYVVGDVRNLQVRCVRVLARFANHSFFQSLVSAFEGMTTVFHMASIVRACVSAVAHACFRSKLNRQTKCRNGCTTLTLAAPKTSLKRAGGHRVVCSV